jgi:hypothetical protein
VIRYRWEAVKDKLQHYNRREPETSVLYQAVYHGHEALKVAWEERFQRKYGVLREEVNTSLEEYLNCGILAHGAARVYCDACKHSLLVAFSCKKRGICPSCGAKRAVKFAEHLYSEVLEDVPHRHIVFTIPKRLRPFMKYDRKLNGILFDAAWGSITEVLGGKSPAAVLTVQTAGEALNWHPHLHGLIADGLFSEGGSFKRLVKIDQAELTVNFCDRVLSALQKQELISDSDVVQILSQEYTGFNVWLGEPFLDKDSAHFVARYVERGPLSLEKLSIQDDIITYTTKDGAAHEFDALEFLAILSAHIPRPYESVTRYYGYYSCRARGERRKREPVQADKVQPSASWAQCIKRIYEVDPLECPRCKEQMRVVAFIQDGQAIKDIMKSLGLPDFRAPPKILVSESIYQDYEFS